MQEKKIRLFFDDPEATDSSSDEMVESTRQKLVTYEISISRNPNKTLKQTRVRRPRSATSSARSSKRGVRMRKWGKWAAEIRDPMRGVRLWLGTFDTQDEASVAYETARVRLQAEKKVAGSPASVLDAPSPPPPPPPPPPPQPAAEPIAEIFAMSHPGTPEFDFKLDMESFLMGDFVEDFMGLGDLPLLGHPHHHQHQFDNGDFSWAAADIFAA